MLDDFEEINATVKSESVQALKKKFSKPSVQSGRIVNAGQKSSMKPDEKSSIRIQSESDVILRNKQKYLKWKSEHFFQKNKFENSQDLQVQVSKNQLIFCLTCGDDFSDFEQLSKHIEIKIECRSSLNEVQLRRNFRPNYAGLPINCPKKPSASKPENNKDKFVIQYNDKITGTTMYKCSICDTISYHYKSTLKQHISKYHNGQNSQNPLWQKTSSGSIKVLRQAQRIFEKQKLITYFYGNKVGSLYKCSVCGVAYNNKSSVVMHIKKHHDGHKIIEKILLQEKELLIKKKPHKCSDCDNSFSQKSNLKKHIAKNHTVSESMVAYKCASCEKTFSEKSNLLQHLHQHIAKTSDSDSDILKKSEPEVAVKSELEVAVKFEPEVVVKEELNSDLDIDNDFLQDFDDFQNVATDPLAT